LKSIYPALLAAAISTLAATGAHAGLSTADAVSLCKAQADTEWASDSATRVKFRGSKRNGNATDVKLQLYPQNQDSYKATCSLDRKTGEIIAMSRDDVSAGALAKSDNN
jgi:hypothetical protein